MLKRSKIFNKVQFSKKMSTLWIHKIDIDKRIYFLYEFYGSPALPSYLFCCIKSLCCSTIRIDRIPKTPASAMLLCGLEQFQRTHHTRPENPMNAIARILAVIRAIGIPLKALGTLLSASCSRSPAKSIIARPKPRDVEKAYQVASPRL